MNINVGKLDKELRDAGIPMDGCNSDGEIWFKEETTEAQKKLAEEVKKKHDPTPDPEPKDKYKELVGLEAKVNFIAKRLGLED